jgi:CSLREA domain-containing protein
MKHKLLNFLLVVPILLALIFGTAGILSASAAATIVTNASDSGSGSLREAIANAAEGDTITFAGNYTIRLASELTISGDLTIDGSGHSVTISGDTIGDDTGDVRVFHVNSGVFFNLNNLTVTKGLATESSGGGIYNDHGTLNITNSTFSGNAAKDGGGIYNDQGIVNVANSTFFENNATNNGGGIYSSGTLTLLNNTFSDNNADVTAGGIYSTGVATVKNTLVVKGTAGNNCSGTLDGTANAADDGSCGVSFANTPNIHLGTPGNYGGSTQTIPLVLGSDAINLGDNATCNASPVNGMDQRGKVRPWPCDMGAYEFEFSQAGPTFIVTTAADYDDNACSDADCTLREAINAANALSDANTITFASNDIITLGSQLPAVTTDIAINGNGSANTIIQASECNPVTLPNHCTPATYRVFEVKSGGALTLNDLTVQNGVCSGSCATSGSNGGGIYNAGTTTISNATIRQNSANSGGGGMYNVVISSKAILTNVTFSTNIAISFGGGGMFNAGNVPGSINLMDVTFSGNAVGGTINNTSYDGLGAGMLNYGSSPELINVTFSQNSTTADGYGGGMYNENHSSPTLTNVIFSDNHAGAGGGMFNRNASSPELIGVLFSANQSGGRGGGMYNESNSSPTLINVTFSNNEVGSQGGGMYNNSNPTLMNVTFSGNIANQGGGMYNGSGVPTLTNTIIANSVGGDCSGTLDAASAYNLIEGSACGLTNGVNGNIVGPDPLLGSLVDNGGFTQTQALLSGSRAINAGTNTGCPATDQRGVARPQGSHCDIGAYEQIAYGVYLPLVTRR